MAFTPAPANTRASVSARHRPASVIPTPALMPPARSAWRTTNTVRAGSAARARRQTASSAGRRSPKVGVGLIDASILQAASGVDEGRSQLTRGQGRKTVSNAGESPRRILTPLRGWGVSGTVPHGLRRGLLSCAPSGLGRSMPRTSRNLPAGVFHEFPRAAGPLQQTRRSAPLGTHADSYNPGLLSSRIGVLAIAAFAACALAGGAQLDGVLRDGRGQAIVGATVNVQSGAVRGTATTGKDGRFAFRALPAGEYSIRAEYQGATAACPRTVRLPDDGATAVLEWPANGALSLGR